MSDLPIEILCEIFTYLSSSPLRIRQSHEFPWYLGKVCSRWRALFFSMRSTFWRKIEIDWHYYNRRDHLRITRFFERVKMILAFFLSRTQGESFSFSLFREDSYPNEHKHVQWVLKDLVNHSRQWDEAFIRCKSSDVYLIRSAKGHLPLLKRLEVIMPSYASLFDDMGSYSDIFRDAPLLTHVVVEDISMWEFNWSSLTTFDISGRYNSTTKTLAILRKAVNLVELTIGNVFWDSGSGLIHLPHLQYLSISRADFLTVLETPALRRLGIHGVEESTSSVVKADGTVYFLCRSRLRLTSVVKNSNNTTILLHMSTI
jgi:hypothetical protein